MPSGQHTLREIMSQPAVWAGALQVFSAQRAELAALWAQAKPAALIVTGCGSTYYLALAAARLLRHSGIDAFACPASELLLHSKSICIRDHRYMLLCLSRSGSTSETVRAQQYFKAGPGGPVITITCDSGSRLARESDLAIAIDAAQEKSVAQTRSFSSMAVVIQQLAAHFAGQNLDASRQLPDHCRQLLERCGDLARSLGENRAIEKFFCLGMDALYGIACEAMLKLKEMSLAYSEAYHTLEFRHGPMSMVGEDSLVIGLISPSAARQEIRLLHEMADLGARILAISPAPGQFPNQVTLPAELPPWCLPVLYLPVLQLLAYRRAVFTGCDPDQPQNLSAVISLEDI